MPSWRYDGRMSALLIWSRRQADALLRETLPRRWHHVRGVAERVRAISLLFSESDYEVLEAAAVLHDIGYAPMLNQTGFHPLDGAIWLQRQGVQRRICALIAHHSCARHEAELRGLSMELSEWTDEKSLLRDALWWADMTTSPDGNIVAFDGRIKEIQDRYGPQDVVTSFIRRAEPELRGAVERTEARMRAAGVFYE